MILAVNLNRSISNPNHNLSDSLSHESHSYLSESSLVSPSVVLINNNSNNNNSNNNANANELDVGSGLDDNGNAHGLNTFKKIYKLQ